MVERRRFSCKRASRAPRVGRFGLRFLGTAAALGAVGLVLFYLAGMPGRLLVGLGVAGSLFTNAMILVEPYRLQRVRAFWDPWGDVQGSGYQIIQSYVALSAGGLWGVGLGQSTQKLFYLPAGHTDFILSIVGEELGLVGVIALLALFGAFLFLGAKIALAARDPYGRLLAAGLVSWIALRGLINIAACVGAIPTKGLPFPFFSYGGSSLMLNVLSVGLLLNVGKDWRPQSGLP
jgi:cell division protein FtsW